MQRPWWRVFRGRLRRELRELKRAGIAYKVDRAAFSSGGLKLELEFNYEGSKYRLVAQYPDTFPYFRVDVEAPDLSLPLHQNPFSKSLCLLGRRTENWRPSDTLAELICDQLPRVLTAAVAADRSSTAAFEEDQGEPATTFYSYLGRSAVLVDSSWTVPWACRGGWLYLGLRTFRSQFVRGAVLQVCDANRTPFAVADSSIERLYGKKAVWIRWTRHEFIPCDTAAELFDRVAENDPRVRQFCWHRSKETAVDITGVLMQEEVARDRGADAWVFVLREASGSPKRRGLPRSDPGRTRLVQAQRAGRKDLTARVPETEFLQEKRVSVVGLGCVGAAVAVELSKAGCGTLTLVDRDRADAGPMVRWPVGFQFVGRDKAEGLAAFISENWPYTKVIPLNMKVGTSIHDDEKIIRGADLIVDCSAEEGVQRYLANLCREHSRTLLLASTTPGARGGIIVRFRTGSGEFCFRCWELYQEDPSFPSPPQDPGGRIQPEGCADPTFTGAGFDAAEVSLMAARTAVGELGKGKVGVYPESWWNYAVLSLRTSEGKIIPPKWDVRFERPHVLCGEQHN
jgi:molybdopterin/thiamine biosynthesis adenylyltransferase